MGVPDPPQSVQTIRPPELYSPEQLEMACEIALALYRGRFILTEKPNGGRADASG